MIFDTTLSPPASEGMHSALAAITATESDGDTKKPLPMICGTACGREAGESGGQQGQQTYHHIAVAISIGCSTYVWSIWGHIGHCDAS